MDRSSCSTTHNSVSTIRTRNHSMHLLRKMSNEPHPTTDHLCPQLSDKIAGFVNAAVKRRLGKLDTYTVFEYLNLKHVQPVSLLTALIFIEKFSTTNTVGSFLDEVTATDLFIVSLMTASKYLFDVDTTHGCCNADWAEELGLDLNDLNLLETRFLSAMNWNFFVPRSKLERFASPAAFFSGNHTSATAVSIDERKNNVFEMMSVLRQRLLVMLQATRHRGYRTNRKLLKFIALLLVAYAAYTKGPVDTVPTLSPIPACDHRSVTSASQNNNVNIFNDCFPYVVTSPLLMNDVSLSAASSRDYRSCQYSRHIPPSIVYSYKKKEAASNCSLTVCSDIHTSRLTIGDNRWRSLVDCAS